MYTLLRRAGSDKHWEFPPLAIALLIAERFYKFHSFTLECVAFLATWLAVSFLVHSAFRIQSGKAGGSASAERRLP